MIQCPECQHVRVGVIDSRYSDAHDAIRRRRECPKCKHRWTTYEITAADLNRINERWNMVERLRDSFLETVETT